MKRHLNGFYRIFCTLIAAALLVSACGGDPVDEPEKQTLTVSICYDFYNMEEAIEKFKIVRPDVEIVLNNYDSDAERYAQEVNEALNAGSADDLLDMTAISDIELADSGLLADFYPLMNNDPNFNRDDYFMNVLDGMAFNGKLNVFPIYFAYQLVGINNTISPEIVDKFKKYDKITYREMIDFYSSLPDKSGRYINWDVDAATVITGSNSFIDFEKKECYFDTPYFIDFLDNIKDGTDHEKVDMGQLGYSGGYPYYSPTDRKDFALEYMFLVAKSSDFFTCFPSSDDDTFAHFVPLCDDNGNLLTVGSNRFCISESSANKDLAWEFVKFLTTEAANSSELTSLYFPVNKKYCEKWMPAAFDVFIERIWEYTENVIEGDRNELLEHATARFTEYNEMPTRVIMGIYGVNAIVWDAMDVFYDDVVTAEQAAANLQSDVSQYLNQD